MDTATMQPLSTPNVQEEKKPQAQPMHGLLTPEGSPAPDPDPLQAGKTKRVLFSTQAATGDPKTVAAVGSNLTLTQGNEKARPEPGTERAQAPQSPVLPSVESTQVTTSVPVQAILKKKKHKYHDILELPGPELDDQKEKAAVLNGLRRLGALIHPDYNGDKDASRAFEMVINAAKQLGAGSHEIERMRSWDGKEKLGQMVVTKDGHFTEENGEDSDDAMGEEPYDKPTLQIRQIYAGATRTMLKAMTNPNDAGTINMLELCNKKIAEVNLTEGRTQPNCRDHFIEYHTHLAQYKSMASLIETLTFDPSNKEAGENFDGINDLLAAVNKGKHYPSSWLFSRPQAKSLSTPVETAAEAAEVAKKASQVPAKVTQPQGDDDGSDDEEADKPPTSEQVREVERVMKRNKNSFRKILEVTDSYPKSREGAKEERIAVHNNFRRIGCLTHWGYNSHPKAAAAFGRVCTAAEELDVQEDEIDEVKKWDGQDALPAQKLNRTGNWVDEGEESTRSAPPAWIASAYEQMDKGLQLLSQDYNNPELIAQFEILNVQIRNQNEADGREREAYNVDVATFQEYFRKVTPIADRIVKNPNDQEAIEEYGKWNDVLKEFNKENSYPDSWILPSVQKLLATDAAKATAYFEKKAVEEAAAQRREKVAAQEREKAAAQEREKAAAPETTPVPAHKLKTRFVEDSCPPGCVVENRVIKEVHGCLPARRGYHLLLAEAGRNGLVKYELVAASNFGKGYGESYLAEPNAIRLNVSSPALFEGKKLRDWTVGGVASVRRDPNKEPLDGWQREPETIIFMKNRSIPKGCWFWRSVVGREYGQRPADERFDSFRWEAGQEPPYMGGGEDLNETAREDDRELRRQSRHDSRERGHYRDDSRERSSSGDNSRERRSYRDDNRERRRYRDNSRGWGRRYKDNIRERGSYGDDDRDRGRYRDDNRERERYRDDNRERERYRDDNRERERYRDNNRDRRRQTRDNEVVKDGVREQRAADVKNRNPTRGRMPRSGSRSGSTSGSRSGGM